MDAIEIDAVATPALEEPVLVEGLPGVGLVGKLAVDQLVAELDGEPVRHVYSEHFPPAVSVEDDGTASLASLTLYAVETGAAAPDLLVLDGDGQAQDSVGQYRLADAVLDIAAEFDVAELVTLGGFGTGEQVEEYTVVGATPEPTGALRDRLSAAGVAFEGERGPDAIVGMSGLLVGLGARRGVATAGLLGVTPGYYVDPASARAVIEVLQETFGFEVALDTLEEQAEQVQELLEQVQQGQQPAQEQSPSQGGEDLRYFG